VAISNAATGAIATIAKVVLFFITSDYVKSFWLNCIERNNVLVSLRYKNKLITRMRIDLSNTPEKSIIIL